MATKRKRVKGTTIGPTTKIGSRYGCGGKMKTKKK